MNQPIDSTFIPFPTPADPAEETAGGGPKRGRPSGYAPKIIDMMCDKIRRFGLSDSAAAEFVGMSSSTVSRWKQLYPEIGPKLQQARQEIRIHHLEIIEQAAQAENGRGWRASAWMLERLFPADYARKMSERFEALSLADLLKDREARAALEVQLKELHAMQDAERAERAAAAQAAAAEEAEAQEERAGEDVGAQDWRIYSEGDSQNSRNSEAAGPNEPAGATRENASTSSETDSHNSRNLGEAAVPMEAAMHPLHTQQAADGPEFAERATSAKRQQAAAVQGLAAGSPNADAPEGAMTDAFSSVTDSHNSRNSSLRDVLSALHDAARPARAGEEAARFYSEDGSHNSRYSGHAEDPSPLHDAAIPARAGEEAAGADCGAN